MDEFCGLVLTFVLCCSVRVDGGVVSSVWCVCIKCSFGLGFFCGLSIFVLWIVLVSVDSWGIVCVV